MEYLRKDVAMSRFAHWINTSHLDQQSFEALNLGPWASVVWQNAKAMGIVTRTPIINSAGKIRYWTI
jgi:hypothetical protein